MKGKDREVLLFLFKMGYTIEFQIPTGSWMTSHIHGYHTPREFKFSKSANYRIKPSDPEGVE